MWLRRGKLIPVGEPPCNQTLTGFGYTNGALENEIIFSSLVDPLPSGSVSYNWNFGDNSGTSTLANPTYQYAAPGNYEVCLDLTLETAGVPSCTGTEFVFPADPSGSGTWQNFVINIKQFPTQTNPVTTSPTRIAMICPEAPFAFQIGEFTESSLPALTVQEVVNSIINWVNVSQGFAEFVATDLGSGYVLIQLDTAWAGYNYCDCLTGITAEGIDLYYNWSPSVSTIDFQDSNELDFAENWLCATSGAGETICLGDIQPGAPAEQCTVNICETITVPCDQESRTTMDWVGNFSAFGTVGNDTVLNLDPPPLGSPLPHIMESSVITLKGNSVRTKLQQNMGCCTSLSGTFYVSSTSPDVLSVVNTGVGEWTVTLGNDGDGEIVITCADFDTLVTGSSNFTPVGGNYEWLSQTVFITGSNDLSLLAGKQVDIVVGFDEDCYPGDLKAELHILGDQPSCFLNGDAYWTGSTSNLFFDSSCYQFDNDPVTNDDPNLGVLFGGNQVEIDDTNMASNSFSLKMFKPGFECCTTFSTASTLMSIANVDTGFSAGTTAVINPINATDYEIQFGGASTGTLTIIAADFAALLEDGTTWQDINCEAKYQYLSQALTFIGSADLDIAPGYITVRIDIDNIESSCGLTGNDLSAYFRING